MTDAKSVHLIVRLAPFFLALLADARLHAAVLVAAVMVGGTFVGITAVGLFIATDLASSYGADPRRMIALVTGIFGIGQMVGPAFAGYVADITGTFTAPSLIAAGALVIGAGLAMTLRMGK